MASAEDISLLRRYVNELENVDPWTDEYLGTVIDASPDLHTAASTIWTEKAAAYADLVDVQEGSSRRSLGDLHEQALSMRKIFAGDDGTGAGPESFRAARTRPIERP